MSSPRLLAVMARVSRDKVATGLLPLLRRMAGTAAPFDPHDVFTRLAFDMTAMAVFGEDPGRMSIDMPPAQASDAMDTVMVVALFRHTLPMSCWRLMRWLNIGPERKLAAVQSVLRRFVAEMIEKSEKSR
ncbi:hypothetical protein BAE44_0014232 [Dichanthelium oligosanthes]|uniref:Uncharacterized protein n=1 Tax=Dichanthelium oligosanthes TaxID=888268 RepID=A0A1E5VHZ6_9POAL|nr:hypothetical protein BAE44_0014232 [Dichanthelium oligosanthes]